MNSLTDSDNIGIIGSPGWERGRRQAEMANREVLRAVHAFEVSLHLTPKERSLDWDAEVHAELKSLLESFQRHCKTAEGLGGVVYEAELIQGRTEPLNEVLKSHEQVLKAARALLKNKRVEPERREAYSTFLRAASRLMVAVREHEVKEMDLIYETHWRVNGGEG